MNSVRALIKNIGKENIETTSGRNFYEQLICKTLVC